MSMCVCFIYLFIFYNFYFQDLIAVLQVAIIMKWKTYGLIIFHHHFRPITKDRR